MERISSFFFAFFLFGKLVWMWIILCRQIAETQVSLAGHSIAEPPVTIQQARAAVVNAPTAAVPVRR